MSDNQKHALRLFELLLSSERKEGRRQRGTTLLCRPEPLEEYRRMTDEEFCRGWVFRLGPHFADALDITLDRRMRAKKPYHVWTQGTGFHFRQGYTIHRADNEQVIQIQEAKAAVPGTAGVERDPGFVRAQFYVPNSGQFIWRKDALRDMTQDELVRYLIAGESL